MMHFEYPWLFLVLPIFLWCEKKCPLRLDLLYFPHLWLVAKGGRRTNLMQTLKWITVIGVVAALASPVIRKEVEVSAPPGRDMIIVLDASRSMDEPFTQRKGVRKFDALVSMVRNFINHRENDRIGLVVFGTYAYIVSPVTFDTHLLSSMIKYLKVGMAGERTALSDALAMGVKGLKDSCAKSKIIIFITDGKNSVGKIPMQAVIRLLKNYHIKLYTIGVGNKNDYNPILLKKLAEDSDGKFFAASDKKMLKHIYRTINKLEPSIYKIRTMIDTQYLYGYPLLVSSLCMLGFMLLGNRGEI